MKNLFYSRISLVLISALTFAAAAWFGRSLIDYLVNGRSPDSGQVESADSLARAIFQDPTKPSTESGEPAREESKQAFVAEPADITSDQKEPELFTIREAAAEEEASEAEEESPTSDPEPGTALSTVPVAPKIDLVTEAILPSQSPDSSESEGDSDAPSDGADLAFAQSTEAPPADPENPGNPGDPGEDPPVESIASGDVELNISGSPAVNVNAGLAAEAKIQDDTGLTFSAELGAGVEAEPVAEALPPTFDAAENPVAKSESRIVASPANQGAEVEAKPRGGGRVIIGGRNSPGSASLYSNSLGGSISGLIGGLEVPDSSTSGRVTYRPHVVTSQYERANPALPAAVPGQNIIAPDSPVTGVPAGGLPVIPGIPSIIPQLPVTSVNPGGVSPSGSGSSGGSGSPIPILVPSGSGGGGSPGVPNVPIIPGVSGNVGGLNLNLDIKVP